MRALIITGGTIDRDFAGGYIGARAWDLTICADAGLEFCRRTGILPDLILGDFDSADPKTVEEYQAGSPERILTYPAQKDETDTELAIQKAVEAGAEEITVIGGTGTRLDHVLGNIHLLKMALDAGVSCAIVDAHNRIRMIRDELRIERKEQFGHYVSLLPFTPEVRGLTLTGFAYEVRDFTLKSGLARGVSNEITAERARITLNEGLLLVIESRD